MGDPRLRRSTRPIRKVRLPERAEHNRVVDIKQECVHHPKQNIYCCDFICCGHGPRRATATEVRV